MKLTSKIIRKFDVPNDSDGGWIEIEHLKENVIDEITAKTSETAMVNGETKITINTYERKKLMVQKALRNWGNLFDENGNPLKFNMVNLNKAAEFSIKTDDGYKDFYTWIEECINDLADEVEAQQEDVEGN